jgi:hypothetical protein
VKLSVSLFIAGAVILSVIVYLVHDDTSYSVRIGDSLIPIAIGVFILSIVFGIRAADSHEN